MCVLQYYLCRQGWPKSIRLLDCSTCKYQISTQTINPGFSNYIDRYRLEWGSPEEEGTWAILPVQNREALPHKSRVSSQRTAAPTGRHLPP